LPGDNWKAQEKMLDARRKFGGRGKRQRKETKLQKMPFKKVVGRRKFEGGGKDDRKKGTKPVTVGYNQRG